MRDFDHLGVSCLLVKQQLNWGLNYFTISFKCIHWYECSSHCHVLLLPIAFVCLHYFYYFAAFFIVRYMKKCKSSRVSVGVCIEQLVVKNVDLNKFIFKILLNPLQLRGG
jgi:hypothetical protein